MASRYWVGGGSSTNWSATGNTNWAATSGGANNASVPTTTDDVFFDANSGAGTSVLDAGVTIISLDCTGFTGTLTHNAVTLTISGNLFRLAAGMTYTPANSSRLVTFTSTSGTTLITCAGKTLGAATFNGAGGTFQPQDAFAVRNDATTTLTSGTLDANNQNITTGAFVSSGSTTRVITPGSGTWTLNSQGTNPTTVWDTSGTNLTLNSGSWTLLASATTNNQRTIQFGTSKTFNVVTVTSSGTSTGPFDVRLAATTGVTIGTLNVTAPAMINFMNTATYTITTLNSNGSSATSANALMASANGVTPTVAVTTPNITYTYISGLNFTGSPSATNSFDGGRNNSTITITGPSGGGVVGVIGG
jgi:hypothetical protein